MARGNRQAARGDRPARPPLQIPLPPETLERLGIYAAVLRKWQRAINLVGSSTLDDLWTRHVIDSWQVSEAVPEARLWADLGSGAGFPGLVTAIRYADLPGASVHLIESDRRKCAFLREVSRETGACATIHCGRIEDVVPRLDVPIDAVSARALAPLDTLITYAAPLLDRGAVGIFSKGKQVSAELTDSLTVGKYLISTIASRTDASAKLVIVRQDGRDRGRTG